MCQGCPWESESSRNGAPIGVVLTGQGLVTRSHCTSPARQEGTGRSPGAAHCAAGGPGSAVLRAGWAVRSWSPALLGQGMTSLVADMGSWNVGWQEEPGCNL